jgi:HD-GYP domain-containing protein (c-di-GMP phosphodiesterase class II)
MGLNLKSVHSKRLQLNTDQLLYLIPYLLSAFLALGILLYAWRKRNFQGARELTFFLLGQTIWLFGIIFELIAKDAGIKIFWDKFQWFGGVISLLALPYFAARFSNYSLRHKPRFSLLLAIVPLFFMLLLLTDPYHHLLYPDPRIINEPFFSELTYTYTWLVYAFGMYSYIITICSVLFLVIKSPKNNQTRRMQITIISIGALIPILGTIIGLTGIRILPQRDPTPLFTAIGNVVLAWGLFRYQVFEVLPFARETIVDNMEDLVVVLNAQGRVVDINKTAHRFLRLEGSIAIGSPVELVLKDWPGILAKFDHPENMSSEEYIEQDGNYYHYDVKSTLIHDEKGHYMGRVFVARDVTPYAKLQWLLKSLNENLELRVLEKTSELAEAYDTTLEGWAKALELRDKETEGHSRRVVEETLWLARALGVSENDIVHMHRGAILHDIGKMAIPDDILRKKGELTAEDWQIIKKHPEAAYGLLKDIPYLSQALEIPYCHHEHWDGSGYPRGLKGEEIPLAARIFTVVDVWDALLSDRSYRAAWPEKDVIEYIEDNSGLHFDPFVAREFLKILGVKRDL